MELMPFNPAAPPLQLYVSTTPSTGMRAGEGPTSGGLASYRIICWSPPGVDSAVIHIGYGTSPAAAAANAVSTPVQGSGNYQITMVTNVNREYFSLAPGIYFSACTESGGALVQITQGTGGL